MQEEKFTSGKWSVERRTTKGEFVTTTHIISEDKSHIALVGPCSIKANADLIASAPELLEVIETALTDINTFEAECAEREHTDTGDCWSLLGDIHAAMEIVIAKAYGETNDIIITKRSSK